MVAVCTSFESGEEAKSQKQSRLFKQRQSFGKKLFRLFHSYVQQGDPFDSLL